MQNNLHLSFSFSDSARTGDHWLVPVIVLHNNSTPAQSKSLIIPKNFVWPEDPQKKLGIEFLALAANSEKFHYQFFWEIFGPDDVFGNDQGF